MQFYIRVSPEELRKFSEDFESGSYYTVLAQLQNAITGVLESFNYQPKEKKQQFFKGDYVEIFCGKSRGMVGDIYRIEKNSKGEHLYYVSNEKGISDIYFEHELVHSQKEGGGN